MKKLIASLMLLSLSGLALADSSTNTMTTTAPKTSALDNLHLTLISQTYNQKSESAVDKTVGVANATDIILSYKLTDKDSLTFLNEFSSAYYTNDAGTKITEKDAVYGYIKYKRKLLTEANNGVDLSLEPTLSITQNPDWLKGPGTYGSAQMRVVAVTNPTANVNLYGAVRYYQDLKDGNLVDAMDSTRSTRFYFTPTIALNDVVSIIPADFYHKISYDENMNYTKEITYLSPKVDVQVTKKVGLEFYGDFVVNSKSRGKDRELFAKNFEKQVTLGATLIVSAF